MTITRSDRKYFAGGVNPHDENVFGILIETFSMLNLNIGGRYYQRTHCKDEQKRPRSECVLKNFSYRFLRNYESCKVETWYKLGQWADVSC